MDMHDADRNLLLGILALQRGMIRQEVLVNSLKSWVLEKQKPFEAILATEGKLADAQLHALNQAFAAHLKANGQDVSKSLATLGTVGLVRDALDQLADGELNTALAFLNGTHETGMATQMMTLDHRMSAVAAGPAGLATQPILSGQPAMPSRPIAAADPGATLGPESGSPTLPVAPSGPTGYATQEYDAHSPNAPKTLSFVEEMGATQAFSSGDPAPASRPKGAGTGNTSLSSLSSSTRYRSVRPLARGGLGELFVAHDEELSREVALKEIQGRHADREDSRMRFLLEAEVTGGLEHPGIVPVYGLGQYPDGRPWYAMKIIRGKSFENAIDCFHGSDITPGRDPGAREFELRQLLTQFIAVCNAIDYAHSRGVLHRDIKPANVMLGSFGETLVVDWGLAKTQYRAEIAAPSDVGLLRPMSASGKSETLIGSAVGTPQFMSPEQAEGQLDILGPPSDIYSLGATLYYVLTGKVAFNERNIATLFQKLKAGQFVRPRMLNHKVPAALEAICLKAMALHPADRYQSAHDLADDVEHWLADEPVSVYREPLLTRLARWAKRHKTLVTSAAVVLGTAVVALAVGTVLIKQEQARTEIQFQHARAAVDQMLTELAQVELADVPQMEPVRKKMLGEALVFYKKFLAERGHDLSIRQDVGRAYTRLGDIQEMLGTYQGALGAEDSYNRAIAMLAPLVTKNPKMADYQRDLATALHNQGVLEKKEFRFEAAENDLSKAREFRKQLAAADPKNADLRRDEEDSVYQLGAVLARLADRDQEAESAYREAIAAERKLTAEHPDSIDYKRKLARYLNNLGILLKKSDPPTAEDDFNEAVTIEQALAEKSPTVSGLQWELARSTSNLGSTLEDRKHDDEAEAAYRQARDRFKKLADSFPSVPDYRFELAGVSANLGKVLANQRKYPESEAVLGEAIALYTGLVKDFQARPDYPQKLVETRRKFGQLLANTNRADDARTEIEAAIQSQKKLVAVYPQVPEYQSALGLALDNLAIVLYVQKRVDDARPLVEQAIEHQQIAVQASRHNLPYRAMLLKDYDYLAETLASTSDHAAAVKAADGAVRLMPDEYGSHYRAAKLLALASVWVRKETELKPAEREQRSKLYADRALAELKESVDLGFRNLPELDRQDFNAIRERAEFSKVKQQIESKLKPPPVG
jgi:eukaryotic-like serine/threonine-protein kinase